MQVYIEYAILDNLIINTIILCLTSFCLRLKICFWRLFLAVLIGTTITILMPLYIVKFEIIIKIAIGLIMCLICCTAKGFRSNITYIIVFLTTTFVIGGFCFFIIYLLGGDSENLPLPLSIITLLIAVYVYFLSKAIKVFYCKKRVHSFIYSVKIKYKNNSVKINAFLDTGNRLIDNQKPIVIINQKTFEKLCNIKLSYILLYKDLSRINNAHYIKYNTISGQDKLLVFSVDEFIVENKSTIGSENILIGVSIKPFGKEYDAILNAEVLC